PGANGSTDTGCCCVVCDFGMTSPVGLAARAAPLERSNYSMAAPWEMRADRRQSEGSGLLAGGGCLGVGRPRAGPCRCAFIATVRQIPTSLISVNEPLAQGSLLEATS